MKALIDIKNLSETIAALFAVRKEIPEDLNLAMYEALSPMLDAESEYPPQPPSMAAPGHRLVKTYQRTGYYGRSNYIIVQRIDNGVYGSVVSPASYAKYVRGDGEDYPGAWMHVPFWTSLRKIKDKYIPAALAILRNSVNQTIARHMR